MDTNLPAPQDWLTPTPLPALEESRVLLIDDQAITGILLGRMLADQKGMRLLTCIDPRRGMEMAERFQPSVILLDLIMPGIDGLTLLQDFRRDERFLHVPIVMLSAQEESDLKARSFACGANDYLIKLPDPVEMIARLRYHAENHHQFLHNLRTAKELRAIARRFQLVTRSVHDAIITANLAGQITFWNLGAEKLFGYSEQEAIGMDLTRLMPATLQERCRAAFHRVKTTGVSVVAGRTMEFTARRRDDEEFTIELSLAKLDEEGIDSFVAVIRDVTERKQAEEKLHYQANYDSLTGLPNRVHFLERLEHTMAMASRQRTGLTLMFIDLDRFKWVNDTLGHQAGDDLLRETARRLNSCVRRSDLVARLGGDEFTAILYGITDHHPAGMMATRILEALSDPYWLENQEVCISGSIGVTFYPEDASQLDELMRNADMAMYVAKNSGKNTHWFFRAQSQV